MENNWIISQKIDLAKGINGVKVWPNALMLEGDKLAHTWSVEILDDGRPAEISGHVRGFFVRADGNTVMVEGTAEGNFALVTLTEECYAYEGDLKGIMQISDDTSTITISALLFRVRSGYTTEIIDPGEIVPSLDDLLSELEAMRNATSAANTATDAANTATSNADAATQSANDAAAKANSEAERASEFADKADTAAQSANGAASAATEAAQGVQKAIEDANAATEAANQAAADAESRTDAAVQNAETKTNAAVEDAKTRTDEAIKSAQETIDSTVSDANAAIEEAVANAEAATQAANTAAGNANTAADGANVQANAAEQAAQSAGNAAGSAQSATEAAQEAARKAEEAAKRANDAAAGKAQGPIVVDALPDPAEAQVGIMYLVPAAHPNPNNIHDEYMIADGTWELIGSTAIDISDCVKMAELQALLARKLDADATAVAAVKATQDGAGNNINTTYVKSVTIEGTTVTITRGDGSTTEQTTQDTTYEQATDAKLGLVRLYSETGNAEDGAMTQAAITTALAGKADVETITEADIDQIFTEVFGA